jgi:RNA polymerase sigma-70 factor, ECF subfamily
MGHITLIEDIRLPLPSLESTEVQASTATQAAEAHAVPAPVDLPALVATYSALLYRVAHSILRSRTEAEDVVQDVFLRLVEHRFDLSAIRDMRVWLVRIAWNLALDRRRRIRPDQMNEIFAHSLVARTVPTDQALDETRRMHAALRALEKLPNAEQHVLLLAAIEELSTKEIATVMEKSESAVRALLFRARTRLRERLGKLDKGGKA